MSLTTAGLPEREHILAAIDEGASQHAEYMPACWSADPSASESHGNARRLSDGDGDGAVL